MRLLTFAMIPLAMIGVWVAWRALRGRPVRRFALNAVVAIALLTYFAITAGLGIFWVANQELPVFDPHYLFGYLTLLLVAVHVTINGPVLIQFVRRRSRMLSPDGKAFRPTVAWAARVGAIGTFGGVCAWIGYSQGTSVVRVERGEPVRAEPAGGGTLGMAEQIVIERGQKHVLSRWYHERSKLSRVGVVGRGPALDWSTRPPPFESYPARAIVELPRDRDLPTLATGSALDRSRAVAPGIAPAPVSLDSVATLLHLAQGITSVTGPPGDPFYRRAAASSGALYPTVIHAIVGDVDGLAPGVYHYEPKQHALHLVRDGDVRPTLARMVAHPHAVERAPIVLVLSVIYYKTSWKYEERGYRYCLLDAGHVAANAIVAGAALGLASMPIGRFDDAALATLVGIEPARQGGLLVLPFGAASEAPSGEAPRFEPVDLDLASSNVPAPVMLAASRTALRATSATQPAFGAGPPIAPRAKGTAIAMAAPTDHDDAIGAVIERRRSERRFGETPLSAELLTTILRRAFGPSVEHQHALRLHAVVSRVEGVTPGAYELVDGSLVPVRTGDLASAIHAAALSQEVSERAAVVLVFSVDAGAMAWPDGSRGYRYGWLDAGIAAGRVYLQAVALGLGVSSIGAFFDDDVSALLHLDPAKDLTALLVAVGTKP